MPSTAACKVKTASLPPLLISYDLCAVKSHRLSGPCQNPWASSSRHILTAQPPSFISFLAGHRHPGEASSTGPDHLCPRGHEDFAGGWGQGNPPSGLAGGLLFIGPAEHQSAADGCRAAPAIHAHGAVITLKSGPRRLCNACEAARRAGQHVQLSVLAD